MNVHNTEDPASYPLSLLRVYVCAYSVCGCISNRVFVLSRTAAACVRSFASVRALTASVHVFACVCVRI